MLKLKERLREQGWDDDDEEEPAEKKLKQIKSPVKQDRRKEIEKEPSSFEDQNFSKVQLK